MPVVAASAYTWPSSLPKHTMPSATVGDESMALPALNRHRSAPFEALTAYS